MVDKGDKQFLFLHMQATEANLNDIICENVQNGLSLSSFHDFPNECAVNNSIESESFK